MVIEDVLAHEPSDCAARDNIRSIMLAGRETGSADCCSQAVSNDRHNFARRIFMRDERSERPGLNRVAGREPVLAFEEAAIAALQLRPFASSGFFEYLHKNRAVEQGLCAENADFTCFRIIKFSSVQV